MNIKTQNKTNLIIYRKSKKTINFIIIFGVTLLMSCKPIKKISNNQKAEFTANLNELKKLFHNKEVPKEVLEMEWLINRKKLTFSNEKIEIIPNPQTVDTILFKKNHKSDYDTILCNISKAEKYNFVYNTCCQYFNVKQVSKEKRNRKNAVVTFSISKSNENKDYIGIMGEAGIIIRKEKVEYSLFHTCSSAMTSNVYHLTLNEVSECKGNDNENCRDLMCVFENNDIQIPKANTSFKITKKVFDFLYLDLNKNTLRIKYNFETTELKMENHW